MTKVTIKPDCGNSPKRAIIRDFNIAFAEGNSASILNFVGENITWCVYGDFEVKGKKAFAEEIDKMLTYPRPKELTIETIITHGSEAAASGLIVMEGETYAFCDVYKFQSAGSNVLVELKSFIVKI